MTIRVEILTERCYGYANCLSSAPELFDLVDDVAVLRRNDFDASHREALELAARRCPTQAIVVHDQDGE